MIDGEIFLIVLSGFVIIKGICVVFCVYKIFRWGKSLIILEKKK